MPRIICASCKIPMRVAKNGRIYLETTPDGQPVNAWHSDEYYCPTCGSSVLAGFGMKPARTILDPDFSDYIESYEDEGIIRGTA